MKILIDVITCLPQCPAPHCPELTSPQRTPDPVAELSALMLPLPLGELRLCKGDNQDLDHKQQISNENCPDTFSFQISRIG